MDYFELSDLFKDFFSYYCIYSDAFVGKALY